MRNGDAYRIKSLSKSGVSESEIIRRFRNQYEADEVKKFLPTKRVVLDAPKTKTKKKKKAKPKAD